MSTKDDAMLEKPPLADEHIATVIQANFGVGLDGVTFLPLGADVDTAVYRGDAAAGPPVFIKLRRGDASGLSVQIPHALHAHGIDAVIAPLETLDGRLWTRIDDFLVTLTPFITGKNGFDRPLSDEHWMTLGRILRGIHTVRLPGAIADRLPREDFSDEWRDLVRVFQVQAASDAFDDAAAKQMAAIMRAQKPVISELIDHAQRFADELRKLELEFVPCHADIHGGNVLIDDTGKLYVVDWDTFMLAPKERDLMFVGAGIGGDWRGERPERLFYSGYGPATVDHALIAYYRCERVLVDIAAYGKQLLRSSEGGADRAQSLRHFVRDFEAGGVIDLALASVEQARTL